MILPGVGFILSTRDSLLRPAKFNRFPGQPGYLAGKQELRIGSTAPEVRSASAACTWVGPSGGVNEGLAHASFELEDLFLHGSSCSSDVLVASWAEQAQRHDELGERVSAGTADEISVVGSGYSMIRQSVADSVRLADPVWAAP
jgi:hypothetical protein